MRTVLAIAGIAIRNAIRSRVVLCLFAVLALVIGGLPLVIKGDGTLEGQVQILLDYTLGLASMILSLAMLWAGCAAISSEIAEKQIHLVVTKPVSRLQVWIGKWLGLMAVNVVLLAFCGIASYALLNRSLAKNPSPQGREALDAKRTVWPAPVVVEDAARAMFADYRKRGEIPTNVPPEEVLQSMRQSLLVQAMTVKPGLSHRWEFDVPPSAVNKSATLQFKMSGSRMGMTPIVGTWRTGPPDQPGLFQEATTNMPGTQQRLKVPALAAHTVVEYVNSDTNGVSVLFMPHDAPVLLVPAGGFEGNFARALTVVLAHIAFLTAVGVTAGALFSLPVAGFLSLCLVVLLQLSDYITTVSQEDIVVPWHDVRNPTPGFGDIVFRIIFQMVRAALAPLQERDALGAMASGQVVDWLWVGHAVLVQVVAYGVVLAAIGTIIFNRREVGLPDG